MRSALACFLLAATPVMAADLVIENVTIVSPEAAAPLPNRSVLIRDGRIAVVSDTRITAPDGTERLNAKGKFLTPGIMDSHVHVSSAPGLPLQSDDAAIEKLRESFFTQQPRSYLYFGVTQLLDPSNIPGAIATFQAQPQRPDLFRCGAAPALDGYPILLPDPAAQRRIFTDWIYEPANASAHPLPDGENAAAHTPEAVVARIAGSGAKCVKVFVEDGFGPRTDLPILSADTLNRVRTAAHAKGLLVVAHANALGMQQIAVAAQVDVLAHGLWNWDQVTGDGVPPAIAEHLAKVHAQGTGFQPTLRVLYGLGDLFRADTLKDPEYAKVVPPALLAWYGTEPGGWYKREMQKDFVGLPDERVMGFFIRAADQGMRAMKYLHGLGHPLLLGSDTPSSPTYGMQPGYDTYREMRLMAQGGIPLKSILEAATINNAKQFGLDRDYGTVEVGKVANLLVLNANPLASIRAWSQIDRIVLHGRVIERRTLVANPQ